MKILKINILILLFSINSIIAQNTITGTVTDDKGIPIPSVSVSVKGAKKGTLTDFFGKYSLNEISTENILVFSYLGYKTIEIKVVDQKEINVKLSEDVSQLDEIVVVGYGTVNKKDLTGSVSKIKAADLAKAPTANFDQAIAGRAAGVKVTSNDGTPGESLNITIRGGNSITGDNSPLYVIDGIPFEDFDPSSISTRDIKSFDILKDASATAIYGSRGANGVIVITTLDGRTDGKFDVKVNSSVAFQFIPNRLKVLSPYEYVKYQEKVAYANDNYSPGFNVGLFGTTWIDPELYRNDKGFDWQERIFRTAILNNHNFSFSGGTKKSNVYFSGGYVNQEGTLINTGFKKYNNRLKFNTTVNDNFKIRGQVVYSNAEQSGLRIREDATNSVIRNAISFRPINPVNYINNDEDVIFDQDPFLFDPVKTLQNIDQKRKNEEFATTLALEYKFLSKFTLNLKGNFWSRKNEQTKFYGADTREATRTNRGINGIIANRKYRTISTSNTLRFRDRKKQHKYSALVGVEAQYRDFNFSQLRNTNLPIDSFTIYNLGIATGSTIAQSSFSESALLSYFGRLNYSFKNKYLATVNFRADGSSKFRNENRWGYFPSFSFAWKLNQENFIKSIGVIDDLKLRAGWGLTGNNRIGDFDAFNLFSVNASSGYVLGETQSFVPGAYQRNLAVPDLKWETTEQTNIGLNLGLFKNLDVTVDYYFKRTRDLLLFAEMSPSTGFDRVQQNIGEVNNSGLEITLDSKNISTNNFEWRTNFNIAFNRNEAVSLNSGQSEILVDPQWNDNFMQTEFQYITRVGNPVGMIYGLEFDGIYQLDDFILTNGGTYQLKPGLPSYRSQMQPGMVKFKDQPTIDTDGDGIADTGNGFIDENDRKIIGNPQPKHIGGFSNEFKYKNFDFQFLFQWAFDFDLLNANKAEFGSIFQSGRNGFSTLNDIWTPTNPSNNTGGMRFNGVNLTTPFGYKLDNRHVDDGSYLRLQTVTLGYNFPKELLEKLNINKLRISVSGQNLYTWTNYQGYNPDVSTGRFGALTPGLDYSAYPQSVTISGGIEVRF